MLQDFYTNVQTREVHSKKKKKKKKKEKIQAHTNRHTHSGGGSSITFFHNWFQLKKSLRPASVHVCVCECMFVCVLVCV